MDAVLVPSRVNTQKVNAAVQLVTHGVTPTANPVPSWELVLLQSCVLEELVLVINKTSMNVSSFLPFVRMEDV